MNLISYQPVRLGAPAVTFSAKINITKKTQVKLAQLAAFDPEGVEAAWHGVVPTDTDYLTQMGRQFKPPLSVKDVGKLYGYVSAYPKQFTTKALRNIRGDYFQKTGHCLPFIPQGQYKKPPGRTPDEWKNLIKQALQHGYTTKQAIADHIGCSIGTVTKYYPGKGFKKYKAKQRLKSLKQAMSKGDLPNTKLAKKLGLSRPTVIEYKKRLKSKTTPLP
jgi:hypothetical protein